MNHLLRGHAPLTDSNWKLLDDEARDRLAGPLAARRLVDFVGPQGWEHSSTNLGRVESVEVGEEGVKALQRRVLPLVEVRGDFTVSPTASVSACKVSAASPSNGKATG